MNIGRDAAKSVLNGTIAALELMNVDDGSTDGTGAAVVDLRQSGWRPTRR